VFRWLYNLFKPPYKALAIRAMEDYKVVMEDYKVVVAAHASQGEQALAIMNSWQAQCQQLQKENKELIAINERLLFELGKALMVKCES
jgi:hypothetical protein